MSLREEQTKFAKLVPRLIDKAFELGFEVTLGDAFATSGHSRRSYHYKRLAIDLNLFKNGIYLRDAESHRPLGEWWKEQGGTWGGDFKRPDGNHYSWGE